MRNRSGNQAGGPHQLVHVWGAGDGFSASVNWAALDAAMPPKGETLFSSEMFFWLYDPAEIQRLGQYFHDRFDEISVIVYLRRQDKLALSHRKQVIYGAVAKDFYGLEVSALPHPKPHFDRYFDYHAKLALWAEAFGRQTLVVRRFEPDALVGGDVLADFAQIIGVPELRVPVRENVGLTRNQALVGLTLQADGYRNDVIYDIMEGGAMVSSIPDTGDPLPDPLRERLHGVLEGGRFEPARAEAESFVSRYVDSNRRLAETYGDGTHAGYFDPSFEMYRPRSTDRIGLLDAPFRLLLADARKQARRLTEERS